jgi:hypothetical protein
LGREQEFLDAFQNVQSQWRGWKRVDMIQTGERSYCTIGEWEDMAAIAVARPNMIATLNTFRDTHEDFGGSLGLNGRGLRPGHSRDQIDPWSVALAQWFRRPGADIVQERPKRDPHCGHLFVFRGHRGQQATFCI